MGLACAGCGIGWVVDPLRLTHSLTGRPPVLLLNGEIDVRIWIGFPALALKYPTRLPSAARISAARHHISESAVGILRIFFQIADSLQSQLVTQLHATQVQHAILHRN